MRTKYGLETLGKQEGMRTGQGLKAGGKRRDEEVLVVEGAGRERDNIWTTGMG